MIYLPSAGNSLNVGVGWTTGSKHDNTPSALPHRLGLPIPRDAATGAPLRAYLCGAMTNRPQFAFPEFDAIARELRARGIDVVTPSELDNAKSRKAALASRDGDPDTYFAVTGESRGKLLGRDVRIVLDDVDAVIVLPGWRKSSGARLETFAAWLHDKPVLYYPTLHKVPRTALFSAWTGRDLRKRIVIARPAYDASGD